MSSAIKKDNKQILRHAKQFQFGRQHDGLEIDLV